MAIPLKPASPPLFNFTTRKHVPILALGILCSLVTSFAAPLFSILLGKLFNLFTLFGGGEISNDDLIRDVSKYCVHLVGLGAFCLVCNGVYFTLFVVFGELQAANARGRLFEGLLKKDQRWFEAQDEGIRTFITSLQIQVQDLQTATSQPLGLASHYLFRVLGSLGLAFYTSWNLTLVILAAVPIGSAVVPLLSPKINASIEAQEKELKSAAKVVNNAVASIDTVKCLNGQEAEQVKFLRAVDKAAKHHLRHARFDSLQISIMQFVMFAMFVQGFWYGSYLVTSGRVSAGDVLRTFWACSTAAQSMEAILPRLMVLKKGSVAASALRNTLHDRVHDASPREMEGASYPRHCEGDIEVTKLSFSYPSQPDRLSLDSASFVFPAGATTFVIGKSGSGKSTLGQLLTRFYLPTSGEILIDGIPIQTLSINWIRNNITYVDQRSILFNESIFKNIAFGRCDHEDIRKQDVMESIDLAMLTSVIENLPHGIDTCVGDGGKFLSGGQRQRVAIARARLRDTPILILDEPTSALDGTNRIQVMKAIRDWRKGKTTIIITHDMSQILDDDFVYILDQGSVVQTGYKHELKANMEFGELFREDNPMGKTYYEDDADDVGNIASDDKELSDASSTCSNANPFDKTSVPGKQNMKPLPSLPAGSLASASHPSPQRGDGSQSSSRHKDRVDDSFERERFVDQFEIPMGELGRTKSLRKKNKKKNKTTSTSGYLQKPIQRAMRSILPNLTAKQRFLLFIAGVCTLVHASATPVFSYFLSQLLQTFYNKSNDSMRWALAVLGAAIGDALAIYFMYYLLQLCGAAWVDRLRTDAFRRVLDQARKWFEEEQNGAAQLSACLHESGEEVRNLLARFSAFVLVAVSITLLSVTWSLAICWKLTLVALSCGPVIYAITRGFEKTSGLWDRRCTAARMAASDVLLETFSEIRTVRSLTLEHYFHRKHLNAMSKCLTMGLRKAVYTGMLFGLVESMIKFVSALIFYYGAALVRYEGFTVGDIMTVFSVLLFSIGYASTVMSWVPQMSTSREMAKRLFRLVDLPEHASHEHLGYMKIPKAAPVKITRLNFRYPSRPDAPVLRNVSIHIPEGSCTAIVGRSGSGKSTIASLLLSLYEAPPPSYSRDAVPTISFGGIDIRKLHTPSLRTLVSIVSQQPTIFPGTIQDNISYGSDADSPLGTIHSVRAAARAAGIDDFIVSLPKGYRTVIGDGGIGLSGGQAQRIAIARALVRKPQILVLDEATSALDPSSAGIIKQTVQKLVSARAGLTVIIITHAKEMMEIADNIVVLEQGRLVEEGAYKTLAKRPGGKLRALIEHPGTAGP